MSLVHSVPTWPTLDSLPSWVCDRFFRFYRQMDAVHQYAVVCLTGFVLLGEKYSDPDCTKAESSKDTDISRWWQGELSKGFPLFYQQQVIAAWTYLEAFVRDFCVDWIVNNPSVVQSAPFVGMKVSLAEFMSLDFEAQRSKFETIEGEIKAKRKCGTERFEAVLALFKLNGQVESELHRDIKELHQVRNVIVHKAGVADRRLVERCPWMGLEIGQELRCGDDDVIRYSNASTKYVNQLFERVGAHFDGDPLPTP